MLEAAPLIPLLLPLPISLDDPRVSLSALLLVVRMFIPPLLLAFANDLAIHGIGDQLLAVVVGSSLALTGRLATDHLLGSVDRRDKETLTVRTAVGRAQTDSSGLESLRRTETVGGRQDLETTVEFVPRPRQQGLSLAGSLAPAFSGENGSVFHRRGHRIIGSVSANNRSCSKVSSTDIDCVGLSGITWLWSIPRGARAVTNKSSTTCFTLLF